MPGKIWWNTGTGCPRGGRCLIPGNTQSQAGQGSEQPDLVEDVPAHCRKSWTKWSLKVISNPNYSMIPWRKVLCKSRDIMDHGHTVDTYIL